MDQAKKTIKAKEEEIIKLKNTAENLTTKCRVTKHELSNENHELREELAVKETELGEAFEERVKLEEKMNSLSFSLVQVQNKSFGPKQNTKFTVNHHHHHPPTTTYRKLFAGF